MNKINKIIIFVLLLLLGVLLFQNFLLRRSNDKVIKDSGVLPNNVKQEITVKKDKVTIKKKVENNAGSVEVKTDIKYIPPEGELKITTKDDGTTDYELTNKGFTFTPGIVIIPSKESDIGVNVRLLYYKRLGAGIGGVISIEDSPKAGVIGVIDYRIYNNFAFGIAYKESFNNRKFGASFAYYF